LGGKKSYQTAVIADGVSWSYSEFEDRTNQIAATLVAKGIKPGDRVSFVLPRGPNAVLLLVSILKTVQHMSRSMLSRRRANRDSLETPSQSFPT